MSKSEIFDRDYMFKGRGLDELRRRVGGVEAEIDSLLECVPFVNIVELGCGFGTALLELRARYGERVKLTGINRSPEDGDQDILRMNARKLGLSEGMSPTISLAYCDLDRGLPIDNNSVDFVFSQVAWLYLHDKFRVMNYVNAAISHVGLAKIEAVHRPPKNEPADDLVEVYRHGRRVSVDDAFAHLEEIAFVHRSASSYVVMKKTRDWSSDFALVSSESMKLTRSDNVGVRSVYASQV